MKPRDDNESLFLRVKALAMLLCFLLVSSGYPMKVEAQTVDPFTNITDDNFANYNVVIHDDYIVYWHTNIANESGIFLYQISTGELTTIDATPSTNYYGIDMWGDRVVWQQYGDDNWDIYTYLISRPDLGAYPLIDIDGNQTEPAIYEDLLVYSNDEGMEEGTRITLYDIGTGITRDISDDAPPGSHFNPDIYGNYIVFVAGSNIYMYNIYMEETTAITNSAIIQRNPCIWKNRIVWEDKRNGNWDLYMHVINFFPDVDPVDFNQPIFTGGGIGYLDMFDQINPQLSDHYLVYQTLQNYHWDIYIYTFINPLVGTAKPVVNELRAQTNPSIWENKVVWLDERDYTGTGWYQNDVWLWEKPAGIDLSVGIISSPEPAPLGEELDFLVMITNLGDQTSIDPVLTFALPPDVEFLSMSGFGSEGYTRVGDELYCRLDSLEGNETDSILVKVRTLKERKLNVTAEINLDAAEEDTDPDNNFVSYTASVIWEIPTYLGQGGRPAVAVDQTGRAHFCYLSSSWEGQLIYATISNGRVNTTIVDSSSHNYSPALAIDRENRVHLAYGKYDGQNPDQKSLYYRTNKSGSWSEEELISSNAGAAESICLKLGKNDSLHVSFMTSLWAGGSIEYYVRDEGTWDKRFSRPGSYNSAAFDLDSSDYAHFVYYDLSTYGLCYQTNSPDGTFGSYIAPDPDWTGSQMESLVTDIVLDEDSKPHISYVGQSSGSGTEDYRYAYRDDQGWHSMKIEDGANAGSDNSIDMDPLGNPHTCFFNPLNNQLYYAWRENNEWHKKIIAFYRYDPGNQNSDIAIDRFGFSHIIYSKEEHVYYVTNTVPIPEPEIAVEPASLSFQDFVVGDTTDPKIIVISNVGDADLVINDIRITWRDSASFSLGTSTCEVLSPGDTCSVEVSFNPSIIGEKQALLRIESNDPVDPSLGIILTGGGLDGILLNEGFQDFGQVFVGDSGVFHHKLKNIGNTSLTVQGIYLENGDTDAFYIHDFPAVPFSLDDGDSVLYDIIFKPLTDGEKTVVVKIYSTRGDITMELSGTGRLPGYTLEGEITLEDNTPVNEGRIVIVETTEGAPPWYAYKELDGEAEFIFAHIPEMDMTFRFDPDPEVYPGYLRTYYGNTPYEYEATVLHVDSDQDGIIITLLEGPSQAEGSGEADGTIEEGGGKKAGISWKNGTSSFQGIALDSVPVYLSDQEGNIIHADLSDENGEFGFTGIAQGEYTFTADYQGIAMDDENESLVISKENQSFLIEALVNGSSISTTITDVTLSGKTPDVDNFRVYPNPFDAFISIAMTSPGTSRIVIISPGGQVIYDRENAGHESRIDVSGLEKGIYILKVEAEGQVWTKKIIKI